jgi:hypothetical protein
MAKIEDSHRYDWVNLKPEERLLCKTSGFTMDWLVSFVHPAVLAATLDIFKKYIKLKAEAHK